MSTTYPHPRSVLVQLSEMTGGNLYATRYEALRLLGLDVPTGLTAVSLGTVPYAASRSTARHLPP